MLAGKAVTLPDAIGVAVSSMLVVFLVLLILYAVIRLFPVVFRETQPQSIEPEETDETELWVVLMAALRVYGETQTHPLIRSMGKTPRIRGNCKAGNPLARDCGE